MSELRVIKSKSTSDLYPIGIVDSAGRINSYSTHVTFQKAEGLYNAPILSLDLAQLVIDRSQYLGATSCFFFSDQDHSDFKIALELVPENNLTHIRHGQYIKP